MVSPKPVFRIKASRDRPRVSDKILWKRFFKRAYTGTDTNDFGNYLGLWKGEDFRKLGATTFWRAGVLRFNNSILNNNGIVDLSPTKTVMNATLKSALLDKTNRFHVLPVIFGSQKGRGAEDPRKLKKDKNGVVQSNVIDFIERHEQGHVGLLYVDNVSGQCRYFDYMTYDDSRRQDVSYQEILRSDFPRFLEHDRQKCGLPAIMVDFPPLGRDKEGILGSCGWITAWFWVELLKVSLSELKRTGELDSKEKIRWESVFSASVWDSALDLVTEPTNKELISVGLHCFPQCFSPKPRKLPRDFPVLNLPPRFCLHGAEGPAKIKKFAAFLKVLRTRPLTWAYSSTEGTEDEEEPTSVSNTFSENEDSEECKDANLEDEEDEPMPARNTFSEKENSEDSKKVNVEAEAEDPISAKITCSETENSAECEKVNVEGEAEEPIPVSETYSKTENSKECTEENIEAEVEDPTPVSDTSGVTENSADNSCPNDATGTQTVHGSVLRERDEQGRWKAGTAPPQSTETVILSYYQRNMNKWRESLVLRGRTVTTNWESILVAKVAKQCANIIVP